MSECVFQFEIVIVGAGPAGLAAACAAAESGRRVAVVDDTPWLGGQIWRGQQARPSVPQAQKWIEKFRGSGATLLDRASVIAAPENGVLLAEHPDGPREIHWQELILATGARELFLPFPGWTLPGVMGPGGLQALVKNGWPVSGRRVVVAGSGPLLLAVADGLKKHGAKIVSIAEQAPWSQVASFGGRLLAHPGKLWQGAGIKLRLLGVPYRCGVWPVKAEGDEQVRRVTLSDGGRTWSEDCDLFACGFNLVPNVELPLALGCELLDGFVWVDAWQATSHKHVYCAGEPTGIGGADCALTEGQIAGYAASGQREKAETLFSRRASWHRFRTSLAEAFALRAELKSLATDDTLLCRCEDVTLDRVRRFSGWRDAKLQTRCGMGACQGRVCGAATKIILGWGMESVRPPVLPARVGSLMTVDIAAVGETRVSTTKKP
jgi:NADPH-dependent 2,4-dienoyl-CoA reductase/sulfur reductase-like enzyme